MRAEILRKISIKLDTIVYHSKILFLENSIDRCKIVLADECFFYVICQNVHILNPKSQKSDNPDTIVSLLCIQLFVIHLTSEADLYGLKPGTNK